MFNRLQDDDIEARARLSASPAVVAKANADGTVTVVYALDTIPAGTALRPVPGPGWSGPSPADLLAGRGTDRQGRPLPATGAGDLVVFTAGHASGDELVVAAFAGRVHDGVAGKVQGVYALAMPSRTSSSKRGLTQFMTVLDPSWTVNVATSGDLEGLARRTFTREWPGGTPGLVFRNARGDTQDAMDDAPPRAGDGDAAAARYVARLLRSGVLKDGPVEMIPTWSLPMGRDQVMRERVNPQVETTVAVTGAFGSLYADPRGRATLVPSVLLVGDEEEWAFGAKTGKVHRVVLAAQPLGQRERHAKSNVPTTYRKPRNATPWFVREVEADPLNVARLAAARAARAPRPADAPAAQPARVGFPGPRRPAAPAADLQAPRGIPGRMGRPSPAPQTPAAPAAPAAAGPRRPVRMGGLAVPLPAVADVQGAPAPAPRRARPAGGIASLMSMDNGDDDAPAFRPR